MSRNQAPMPSSSSWPRRGLAATTLFLSLALWTLNFGLIDLIDGFRHSSLECGSGSSRLGPLVPVRARPFSSRK
jgi:hypothetical protein